MKLRISWIVISQVVTKFYCMIIKSYQSRHLFILKKGQIIIEIGMVNQKENTKNN